MKQTILIFSVYQTNKSQDENHASHIKTLESLKSSGVPCLELLGRYNEVNETSILIEGLEYSFLVKHLCKQFNQECYLESNESRHTSLVYPNNTRLDIGRLIPVSKVEAETLGNWSYNETVNQYYITKAV